MFVNDGVQGGWGDDHLSIPTYLSNPGLDPQVSGSGSLYGEVLKDAPINNVKDKSVAEPEHYKKGVQPYDVAKSMYGPEGLFIFVMTNSIKYIQRYPFKYKGSPEKQLDDLIKAKRSLETAIELHKEIHGDKNIRHG
tara:strand:- start:4125 stop:4535 length:411 start_codon:yes stop_codon:yes gene_type:complete